MRVGERGHLNKLSKGKGAGVDEREKEVMECTNIAKLLMYPLIGIVEAEKA